MSDAHVLFYDTLTISNLFHILQGAFTEMFGAILSVFDIDRIRPRSDRVDFCDGLISRGRHECHDGRGRQESGKNGGEGGAHGGFEVLF
jgi:hypothetical protein